MGSPPRVRGKVELALEDVNTEGITPACAGKSMISNLPTHHSRDHPRVCGEKTQIFENA